jgi:DNA-binding GntR family transcriptional regulator
MPADRKKKKRAIGAWPEKLNDLAYNRLEEMIATLELAPGTTLTEQALSTMLSIGRTPVREALQRLAREGLVVILPRKAVIVTETDASTQLLVLEIRREIERLVARASAERATPVERARFAAIADGMEAAARANDDLGFMRLDREFNALLAGAAQNEFAARAMRSLNGHSRRFWYQHYKQAADLPKIARLHASEARVIAKGNAARAMAASDRLIDYVVSFTRAIMGAEARAGQVTKRTRRAGS